MNIKLIGDFLPMGDYRQKLEQLGDVEEYTSPESQEELLENAEASEVIITHDEFSEEVLNQLEDLELIVSWTTGLSNIDLEVAETNNVDVRNVPEYCSRSVAEHAFGLALALARNVPAATRETADGGWDCMPYQGTELKGKTIGIVGFGSIGQKVEKLARGFGMGTMVNNRSDTGHEKQVELDELLEESDFVVLTVSLNDSTEKLIGSEELEKMKDTACLVNVSRGKVVVQEDLVEAVENGEIAGAAVDVLETEPDVPESIRDVENLIVTPHIAWLTDESLQNGARTIYEHVENYLEGSE